ncbi:type VII secretion protein EssC, partial [Streptococcus sanguinis]|uniref:type VII secretion protein EssC n=1 Tax=Streptococcus sanguinis TaxID=1305 RepID=UPI002284CA98
LPHLFLISDEFAELKVNQPDFIKELVSIARVGRSLGVHLILATQKPSGVVDDQIWSNSRFKLALKVADRTDSMEMLKTPDAAEITQTGRAYLQVGNNEVYELFQSAWSGADYQPDKDEMGIEDHTIYLINDLGQYEVLNQDLSGLDLAEDIKEVPTELEAIVSQIQLLTESQQIPPVPQPWLPPLKERMTLQELEPIQPQEAWEQKKPVSVLLGMADIPQAQKQEPVSVNLSKDGHILLYGSPGTGKTTFLQSAAMDLARKFSPKDVTLYLMDFGTNGLAPLGQLPQVADTLLLDQTEKIAKFVRIMERELNRRKKLLSDYGVGTLELYRQASGQQEPAIVILLDSYESMKEEAYEAELFKLLVRISREGLSIGVHLLVTAGRQSNLRAQFYANFKHQLSLPQNDFGEVRSIVGSTPLAKMMEDIKGRALMKRDEVDVIQLALPVAGANDAQVLNNLRQEVASLQEAWTGQRPSAIPMVPEELTEADFYSRASVQAAYEQGLVPLGLDMETVEPITWNLSKGNLLYLTDKEEQMSALTRHIARGKQKVIVLAPKYHSIPEIEGVLLVSGKEAIELMITGIEEKIHARLEKQNTQHVATVIAYNMTELTEELSQSALGSLEFVLDKGIKAGYGSVCMANPSLNRQTDSVSRKARSYKQSLLSMRINDQVVISVNNKPLREGLLASQVHYYTADNLASRIKVIMK